MRGPLGRTGKLTVVIVLITLVLAGGATASHYLGAPHSTPSSSASATTATVNSNAPSAPVYTYKVADAYPHDATAFTEGLVYYNGFLYESSGLYGNSSLRRVDLDSGQILQIYDLPSQYFGEGITVWGNTIIQLTWQNNTGFVYDLSSFTLIQNFSYPEQGWGLTNNGSQLIMSDGTANLYFLNPQTFQQTGEITVRDGTSPVDDLNSLAYINGSVFANVWPTNDIVVINPGTGQVTARIDLTGLEKTPGCHCDVENDVLNGIAYDAQNNLLLVTGKMWSEVYQIQIMPQLPAQSQQHRFLNQQLDAASLVAVQAKDVCSARRVPVP
jgi:glutamine cyclotransferase